MNRRQREALRGSFAPARVRVLFVGESPPASGRFFYAGDSGLYRAMRDVFAEVYPSCSEGAFLSQFQRQGCYLVDLCLDPVDNLPPELRRAACMRSERSLARSIRRLQPESIVTIVRSIEDNVTRATARAGWRGPTVHLPYPGRWSSHRETFGSVLVPFLRSRRFTDEA